MPDQRPTVADKEGYIEARYFQEGMPFVSVKDADIQMQSALKSDNPCEVFNLTVETGRSYFVGFDKILVHNKKDAKGPFNV